MPSTPMRSFLHLPDRCMTNGARCEVYPLEIRRHYCTSEPKYKMLSTLSGNHTKWVGHNGPGRKSSPSYLASPLQSATTHPPTQEWTASHEVWQKTSATVKKTGASAHLLLSSVPIITHHSLELEPNEARFPIDSGLARCRRHTSLSKGPSAHSIH